MGTEPLTPRPGRPMPRQRRSDLSPAFRSFANEWLRRYLSKDPQASQHASEVATALEMPESEASWSIGFDRYPYFDVTNYISNGGDDALLDVLHATIQVLNDGTTSFKPPMPWVEVDRQLAYAHSIWMATKDGLEIRADPTAMDAFTEASAPADEASAQLEEAWANAYDRGGDPSDAWDHAIKGRIPAIVATRRPDGRIVAVVSESRRVRVR